MNVSNFCIRNCQFFVYIVVTINLYLTWLVFKLYCMVYGKSKYYLREKDIL